MKKKDSDQLSADELLQQLQAVYLNGNDSSDSVPKQTEQPSRPQKTDAPTKKVTQKKPSAPAVILALTENIPDGEPATEKPSAQKQSAPEAEDKSNKPRRTEPAKRSAPRRNSQGTTLPRSSPNPFLIKPEETPEEKEPSASEVPMASAPKPRTRPNTVKVPPRKRSGVQTGAIRPKNAPAPRAMKMEPITEISALQKSPVKRVPKKTPPIPAKEPPKVAPIAEEPIPQKEIPEKKIPTPVSAPEVPPKAEKTVAEPVAEKVSEKPVAEPVEPIAEKKAEIRPISNIIVDVDNPSKSTVEPIENVEAAETVTEPPKKRSSLRRSKRQQKIEEGLDATAIIAKRTGLDESDISLIFELGYENELGRLVGYETLKKLKYEHLRSSRADTSDYYAQAYGYRGREYTSATPREQVLAAYSHDRHSLFLRVALMAFLAVVLFIVDFPTLFGGGFLTYATKLPYLFPAVGFVLLGASVFLMKDRILGGWRAFLRFAPSPYSAVSVAIPFLLLYSVASVIAARSGILAPANFATEISLLFLTVCDVIRITDEIRTFRIISETGDKTVLEEVEPRKKKLRQGNRTVKILNDEAGECLYRVRPTHEIVGFFRRVNDLSAASLPFMRLTVFLLICTAASGIAASLILSGTLRGISVAAATLLFSVPASAAFLFFDPLRRANRHLISRRSVLVGEGSVNEYSTQKTIIFNDTETFRAKRQTQIALRDGDDFRRDMRLAGILFRKLGGTLAKVGSAVPENDEPDPTVNLVRLTEMGVEAVVDNKFRLLAGDASFLVHSGVEVPKESTDRSAIRSRGVNILYVAINGTLKLTYEVAYTMSHSFRDIIALLAQTETTLAVQTYDPNLNDAFLHVGFADGDEVVRVIKPAQFELPLPAEITDTGVVTLDGPLATAYPLRAASLIVQARKAGFRALTLGSILPGAVLAFFAVRNLPARLLPFLPLMAIAYRAVWFGISWLISSTSLSRHAVFDDTRENLANEDQPS